MFAGFCVAPACRRDPYRFLICADKFQTGYDEPLLHTMYVDKGALKSHVWRAVTDRFSCIRRASLAALNTCCRRCCNTNR